MFSGALFLCTALCAHAQRGGGGNHGGGGPGGPGGGGYAGGGGNPVGMNGSGGGDYGNRGAGGSGNFGNGSPRNGLQLAPPGRWWDDKKTAKTLNLRPDQQHRMDDILAANKGTLLNLYANLKHEEDKLTSMSREDLQDEAKVFAGIDRVAQARADLEKANVHTLLQIRRELDAQQLAALDQEIGASR